MGTRTITLGNLNIEWEPPKWLAWIVELGSPVYPTLGLDIGSQVGVVVPEHKAVLYGLASLVAGAKSITYLDGSVCEKPKRQAILDELKGVEFYDGMELLGTLAELVPVKATTLDAELEAQQNFFEPPRGQQ